MDKLWGMTLLALGACAAPVTTMMLGPVEPSVDGTATQLDAVAELRAGVERAARVREVLELARNPVTGWMADGVMALVAGHLEARRHDLRRRGASRFVHVSVTIDIDPALDQLLRDLANR